MAVFNPTVNPTSDPNWTNVTKPISDLTADKSKGIALATAAEGIVDGTKVADTVTKAAIKDDVQTSIDALRDNYTAGLVRARNEQISTGAVGGQPTDTLVADNTADIPPGLQNGVEQLTAIGTASTQNGRGIKSNDTLYTGALAAKSKELRAKYPGYRDYIDEQVKSVTGVDPANAFYQNLLQDINQANALKNAGTNKTVSMFDQAIKDGVKDSSGMKTLFTSGKITSGQAELWIEQQNGLERGLRIKAAMRANNQGDRQDQATQAQTDLSTTVGQLVNNNWTTMTLAKGTDTAQGLTDFLQKAAATPGSVNDEQARAIGQQMVALRQSTFQQAMSEANKGGSNSIVAQMGGDMEKVAKVINGQMATFDLAINDIFKSDWGSAYSHMNMNKAIDSDTTNHLYNSKDPVVRNYVRMAKTLDSISPQNAATFFKDALVSDVPLKLRDMVKGEQMSLMTQPFSGEGKLTSLNSVIQKAKDQGVTSPKVYSEYVRLVNRISDPKTGEQEKLNLAHGFFSPEANGDVLKQFWRDTYDAKGRQIPGQYSVYTQLTSPSVAQGMKDLGKKYPGVLNDYKTTTERNFSEQLFSSEIKDLSDISANKKWQLKYNDGSRGGSPNFELLNADGRPLTGLQATELNLPYKVINRLNQGISGLANVYSVTGGDVGGQIMKTLYASGYKPAATVNNSPTNYIPIEDIPGKFWHAIVGEKKNQTEDISNSMRR